MTDGLRSGQVAAAAGVNQQTLRYYERRGLIFEPDRTLGGHRLSAGDGAGGMDDQDRTAARIHPRRGRGAPRRRCPPARQR